MQTMLVVNVAGRHRTFDLAGKDQLTLGREPTNQIVINDPAVSRLHAMVRQIKTGHYLISDLGSANGTFLNGKQVSTPAILTHGDVIRLGGVEVQFHAPACGDDETESLRDESTVGLVQNTVSTVLVADIRAFTKLSEALDEGTLGEIINAWCKACQTAIEHRGGHVDKFIGDCVLASWNHASDLEINTGVFKALAAAADLGRATAQVSERYCATLPAPLRIGVGLNTGPVVMGNVGFDSRRDFTMLGDTVNMAFRYETGTKAYGTDVNLGEATYCRLPHDGMFTEISLELKGRSAPESVRGISFEMLDRYLAAHAPQS